MAKKKGNQRPDDSQTPKDLPHDPPIDDIQDIVEFVDEDAGVVDVEEIPFTFADEPDFNPPAPKASDSVPHVPSGASFSPPRTPKETDSVLEDDLVNLGPTPGLDSAQVSGIFSSVIRQETESAVLSNSEVIRAEPISDSVAIDPISGIVTMKADSDVRAVDSGIPVDAITADDSDLVDAVLESEVTGVSTSEISLPESAVRDERSGHEDAVGQEPGPSINDSSVSLKSFRGHRKAPEKEAVLDLDETLGMLDSPQPQDAPRDEVTEAYDVVAEDDVDFDEILLDSEEGSAVNFGQKPPRSPANSGIDPVAEALESGVRLDEPESGARRVVSEPSVEFDDLIIEDDEIAAVDLGAEESPKPQKASAKLPKSHLEDVSEIVEDVVEELVEEVDDAPLDVVDDVIDVDATTDAEKPAMVADADGIDIDALIGDDKTEVAAAVYDDGGKAAVVDEIDVAVDEYPAEVMVEPEAEIEPEMEPVPPPVTTPRRKAAPTLEAPPPYVEPQKRGWGGLVGGMALGVLLTAGAAAGVWFGAPDLIPSPNGTKNPIVKNTGGDAKSSPLQAARDAIDQGKYADAVAQLKDAGADKAALALRGEARWLAYVQKQSAENAPLDAKDDDVVAAMEDLTTSGNQPRLQQVQAALQGGVLKVEIEQAKKTEKALNDDLLKFKDDKEKADTALAQIEKTLRDAKVIGEDDKLDADTIQKAAKEIGKAKDSLLEFNKALEDAKIEGGAKGIEKIFAAKKDVEDKLNDINKILADEKVKDSGVKGVTEILVSRDKLAKERQDLEKTVNEALQELTEAKLIPAGAEGLAGLVAGAKAARTKSESPLAAPLGMLADSLGTMTFGVGELMKNSYDTTASLAEINFYRVRESFTPTAEQQLDRLAAALANREEKSAALIDDANRLQEWIATHEAKFSSAAKAKAFYAKGLGLRNQQKYAEARESLEKAAEMVQANNAAWAEQIRRSHAELSDPAVYYIPRIEKLRNSGDHAGALNELNAALVVIPNHPRLMAERGLIGLDNVKGMVDDATKAVIRADAEAAANDPKTAASGNYVLGRIEEDAGNYAKAELFFRQALKSANPDDEQTARIRLRLGRLLLKERMPGAAPAAPPAPEPKVEEKEVREEAPTPVKVSMVHPLSGLIAAAVISQPASGEDEESPEVQARVKESMELARQLLDSKDKGIRAQGHMLLGEALSRVGQRTEGLREYAKGLELLYPDAQISRLIAEHPAFSVPDALQRANPLLAEKHYGIGLHLYHQQRWSDAEAQFRQAISYYDKDARYYYFLGLTELEQGSVAKRDAAFHAWEQASRLEANSRPTSREVNVALERIQGDRRAFLNNYRVKSAGER